MSITFPGHKLSCLMYAAKCREVNFTGRDRISVTTVYNIYILCEILRYLSHNNKSLNIIYNIILFYILLLCVCVWLRFVYSIYIVLFLNASDKRNAILYNIYIGWKSMFDVILA